MLNENITTVHVLERWRMSHTGPETGVPWCIVAKLEVQLHSLIPYLYAVFVPDSASVTGMHARGDRVGDHHRTGGKVASSVSITREREQRRNAGKPDHFDFSSSCLDRSHTDIREIRERWGGSAFNFQQWRSGTWSCLILHGRLATDAERLGSLQNLHHVTTHSCVGREHCPESLSQYRLGCSSGYSFVASGSGSKPVLGQVTTGSAFRLFRMLACQQRNIIFETPISHDVNLVESGPYKHLGSRRSSSSTAGKYQSCAMWKLYSVSGWLRAISCVHSLTKPLIWVSTPSSRQK